MTHSMTAFASAQKQLGSSTLSWELKSVNHRYLDVSFRLPEALRFIEPKLRTLLRDQISRGKLECQLKLNDTMTDNQQMVINDGLVNALIKVGERLAETKQVANDLTVSKLLGWPGVIQMVQPEMEMLGQHTEQLFQESLAQLIAVRQTEGNALNYHIKNRLHALCDEVDASKLLVKEISSQLRDKLHARLHALQLEVSETRLDQEIALLLTRMDVGEELDRLQTHLVEVERTLDNDEVSGRRLDFLMQELNREANTLSSKSDSVELTQRAVQMKVLIEQMREQIQNIE